MTLTGVLPSVVTGEYVCATGIWVCDKKHGLQFKAKFIKITRPNTLEGIERYLGSGLIKGIGPHYAKKLISAFGEKIFEVIEESPNLLSEVDGIGKVRVEKITSSWAEQKIVREVIVFLQSHGVSTSKSTRIYKTYGEEAIKIVTENPYCLARDITGIGFLTADKIAKELGIGEHSIIRARAGINYTLMEALSEGHCGLQKEEMLSRAEKLVSIPRNVLTEALQEEIQGRTLLEVTLEEEVMIFLGAYAAYENNVSSKLKILAKDKPVWHEIDCEKGIDWVEEKLKIKLADNQKEALREAINHKVLVITGGPGTGKTTLLKSLVSILSAKKYKILMSAPTGRAAKRLAESTGMEATTVHRLLKYIPKNGGFEYNENKPLECDVLVIDESSMIDIQLMHFILKALPETASLILVGDVDQLPSVGPGHVLNDIISSGVFKVVRLTQIFRQASGSAIIQNAHKINKGIMPVLESKEGADFYFIQADTPEKIVDKIIKLVCERIPRKFGYDPIKDIQILTPMQRGGCGVVALNKVLQEVLNPRFKEGVEKYGQIYGVGDKIMQIENNYDKEVYNGDIGVIKYIDKEEQELVAVFDNREIIYDFKELDEIVLAYASTIHKSQGSEYPVIVMPISIQHYMLLKRNLLYTGVTRGKRLVILVGEKKAIGIAVKYTNSRNRITRLKYLLQQ